MLPLTRNIFRQTATSFNNTTERWKQESYYIQIQMVKCRCLWLPGENLHRSIEKSDDAESNNHGVSRVTSLNGDVVRCDLVNTDSPRCTWPMMLCFCAAKRGNYFFFLFVLSLLFHFKAFILCHRGDRVCGQKMPVFKGERCARRVDSWGLSFGIYFRMTACDVKTSDHLTHGEWFPSLIHPCLSLQSCLICPR